MKMMYLLISIFFFAVLPGCESNDDGRIPITTSSEEALQNFIKGRDLFEKLRGQESLQYLAKAIEIDSNFALAYYYYAISQPTIKDFFKQLDKSVSLVDDVSNGEKYIILGLQAQVNTDQKGQKELFGKLVEEYPKDERSYWFFGNYFYGLQDFEKAIEYYNISIKINKEFAPVYNILGYSYRFLEKYNKAESFLKQYINLIPNDPNPYDSYGELLLKMGEYEASCDQYEKAIALDSNFVASYMGIANNLNYTSQYDKARELLNKVLEIARSDAERRQIYLSLAVSYTDEGKYKKAIVQLNKQYNLAEKKNDTAIMANSIINIANIYFEMDNFEKTGELYQKAYEVIVNSNLSEEIKNNALLNKLFIESILFSKKNKKQSSQKKAKQYQAKAKEMKNVNFLRNSHELFGRIALENKKFESAIDELQQSNLQNPYNLYRLALAYYGNGNNEKAIEYLEKTVKYNALNNFNYAFCRNKAKKMLIDLR